MKKRVIIIGLDGMPWHILQLLIDRDVMPNLNAVIRKGARGVLKSTIPPYTSPSWTSISTGVNPGKHGIFDFQRFRNRSYERMPVNSLNIMYPRLHEMALLNRLRSVMINLPHSYPFVKSKKLTLVTDWLTPRLTIYPEHVKRIASSYSYSANWDFDKEIRLSELEGRINAIRNLFESIKWDLFFVIFSEPDWIMHMGYDAVVRYHRDFTPQIYKSFKMLDEFVGYVVSQQNATDLLFILSDHGFRVYDKIVHMNTVLSQASLLYKVPASSEVSPLNRILDPRANQIAIEKRRVLFHGGISDVRALVTRNSMIKKIVAKISRSTVGYQVLASLAARLAISYSIDFSCSRAFMCASPYGIYINSKRMFRSGIVEPKMELIVADEIVKLLSGIRDPSSGFPLMSLVTTREKVYWGPYVERAPHIIFIPNVDAGYTYDQKFYPKIVERKKQTSHSMFGLLIAYGNAIQGNTDLGLVNAYDVVPTALHYLGSPVPHDTDGKILFRMFSESGYIHKNAVKVSNYKERWETARARSPTYQFVNESFAENDEEKVKERLKRLGYL